MIINLAWKNVWRNKLRSLIIIFSITFGLIGGLFYLAFSNGMVQDQIESTIKSEVSNIQIHNPSYLINNDIRFGIDAPDVFVDKIKLLDEVEAVSTRINSNCMISSAASGSGVLISGIDVEQEKKVSDLYTQLIDGNYFEGNLSHPIIIGDKLAKKLKVKVKSKIVVTIQEYTGNITYGAFRVSGIYKTNDSVFDLMNVFVRKSDLKELINYPDEKITEIAILLTHNNFTDEAANNLKTLFIKEIEANKIIIRTWKDIRPILEMLNNMTIQFTMIFVVIILVALSFGIINTMLMAIMERIREIGMLMAIGMSKFKVFTMIMMETVFLSITGGIFGLVSSWIIIEISNKIGIDLSSFAEGLNAYGYNSFVKPELDLIYYFMIAIMVFLTAVFASILPARKALKLIPSEAVRQDV